MADSAAQRKRKTALTDAEWREVFRLRCASKRNGDLSEAGMEFCRRAYEEDPKRYEAMNDEVFNATVPFGSNVRKP